MADFSFVDGNAPSATTWNANVRDQLVTICTSSTRPPAPVTGRRIWETDTLRGYYYSGAAWVWVDAPNAPAAWTSFTPTWTCSGTAPAIGNGTLTGYYRLVGKTLDASITLTAGSTTTFGTGSWSFAMPASLTVVHATWVNASGALVDATGSTWAVLGATATTTITPYTATASGNVVLAAVTASVPFTWAVSDVLNLSIRCEVS